MRYSKRAVSYRYCFDAIKPPTERADPPALNALPSHLTPPKKVVVFPPTLILLLSLCTDSAILATDPSVNLLAVYLQHQPYYCKVQRGRIILLSMIMVQQDLALLQQHQLS